MKFNRVIDKKTNKVNTFVITSRGQVIGEKPPPTSVRVEANKIRKAAMAADLKAALARNQPFRSAFGPPGDL